MSGGLLRAKGKGEQGALAREQLFKLLPAQALDAAERRVAPGVAAIEQHHRASLIKDDIARLSGSGAVVADDALREVSHLFKASIV